MDYHDQILASIERNLGVLVEGQQRTEEHLGLLTREFAEIPNAMTAIVNSMSKMVDNISSMTNVVTSLASGVTTLAEGVASQAQGVSQLVDITERNLMLLQDVINRVEQLTNLQQLLDQRQNIHEEHLNKLVDVLHRFLESQKPEPGAGAGLKTPENP